MKTSLILLSAFALCATNLMAETAPKSGCGCKNCQCSPQHDCGCCSGSGCKCQKPS